MKHIRSLVLIGALALGACGTAATDNFVASVTNFTRGLAAVDQAVQQVNAVLYKNCTDYVAVAGSINSIAGQCSKAAPYTSVANTVIDNYCQAAAAQSAGIATSISITASSIMPPRARSPLIRRRVPRDNQRAGPKGNYRN